MKKKKTKKHDWPYCGRGELLCRHHVGHGPHVHGCDGCCSTKEYEKAYEAFKKSCKILED